MYKHFDSPSPKTVSYRSICQRALPTEDLIQSSMPPIVRIQALAVSQSMLLCRALQRFPKSLRS